jgi:gas vesicle protein
MEEKVIVVKEGGAFGAFLRGVMIGAAVALLVAPRSGRETRQMLSERGAEVYDKASYIARDTRDRAQQAVSTARNKIEETVKGVKQGADQTTKDLKREVEIMEDVNNPIHPL